MNFEFPNFSYPERDTVRKQKDLILKKDWKCICVLDACRWDVLKDISKREVEPVLVPSHRSTPGWMDAIWNRNGWEDITYISANPMTTGIKNIDNVPGNFDMNEKVKKYIEAFQYKDDVISVVSPQKVADIARREEEPIVVHFLQPHEPFIGSLSLKVSNRERIPKREGMKDTSSPTYRLVTHGLVHPDYCRAAYYANAELGYKYAIQVARHFSESIITADHGEALGENGYWNHGGDIDESMIVGWIRV